MSIININKLELKTGKGSTLFDFNLSIISLRIDSYFVISLLKICDIIFCKANFLSLSVIVLLLNIFLVIVLTLLLEPVILQVLNALLLFIIVLINIFLDDLTSLSLPPFKI